MPNSKGMAKFNPFECILTLFYNVAFLSVEEREVVMFVCLHCSCIRIKTETTRFSGLRWHGMSRCDYYPELSSHVVKAMHTYKLDRVSVQDVAVTTDGERMLCVGALTASPDGFKPKSSQVEKQIIGRICSFQEHNS